MVARIFSGYSSPHSGRGQSKELMGQSGIDRDYSLPGAASGCWIGHDIEPGRQVNGALQDPKLIRGGTCVQGEIRVTGAAELPARNGGRRQVCISRGDRRVSGRHDETCCRRAWAADAAEPLRENLPAGRGVGGKGENAACSEIAAAAAIAHGEQISVGGVRAPEAQERLQRERRIRWRRVAKLIFGIDTVTIGARADFAWAEGDPISLLDDAVVVIRSGELPAYRPIGWDNRRLRAVAH